MPQFIKSLLFLFVSSTLLTACNGETDVDTPNNLEDTVAVVNEPMLQSTLLDTLQKDTIALDTTPLPQKEERPTRTPPRMEFDTITYDYDTITQGDIIEHKFNFTNAGQRPLVINNVQGSCGCTIGSYPFLDIAPGEENFIKARFDSKGKKGFQKTTITVNTNGSPKEYILTLTGFVKEE